MSNKIKKVVIFAGGMGTRLSEKTELTPKPLVPIGPDPVMVHIMRHFYKAGYREFIIAVGYKSDEFKKYFRDYGFAKRNVTFTKYGHQVEDNNSIEDWIVHVIETGETSSTGQRLNAVKPYLNENEPFFLTYGDSVSNVDLHAIEKHHLNNDKIATVTAVTKGERFGVLGVDGAGKVTSFSEKDENDAALINGGFIACDYNILDEVNENTGDFSHVTLTNLAIEGKMGYYRHDGFWHAMDTKQDLDKLNQIYSETPELFG